MLQCDYKKNISFVIGILFYLKMNKRAEKDH